MEISIYKDRFAVVPLGKTTVEDYFDDVKNGRWQDHVLAVRNGKAKKDESVAVTVSGLFEGRRVANDVKQHSGIIGIDLDQGDNDDLLSKRGALENDPYCFSCHTSIRGFGLVWYVKIDPTKHKDAFRSIEQYLANNYGVVVDPSGKDISRLRYVSFDPDLFINKRAKKWDKYIPKKELPVYTPSMSVFANDDISYIMEQIRTGVNIAEDYDSWLRVGFALAKEFGEAGRDYFHIVSSQSSKYDSKKCDKQYDTSLRRSADNESVNINTFFWYCIQAGIKVKTSTTNDIESLAKQKIRSGSSKVDAFQATREYFKLMEGLEETRINEVLERVAEIPDGKIKAEKADDKTTELELFIKSQKLQFNEIKRRVERDGEEITDRDLNSIYLQAMHSIDHNISKNKIESLIDSEIVPSYNPFLEFFRTHAQLKPSGLIKELCACFEYEKPAVEMYDLSPEHKDSDFLEVFLEKWLLSIISSMHGTYSLLVLVLTGGQRAGKTKFFRGLLPSDLSNYYAESKLDKDKDDGILMCGNLLIMDDEFSGKSKSQAARFKEISSRDTFTVRRPYGRFFETLKRYAVLCGTGNDAEILNDPTGNRRLIPVQVKTIDHKRFEAIDKTALFMELYHKWKKIGDGWMLSEKDIEFLNQSTEKHEALDMDSELLIELYKPAQPNEHRAKFVTTSEIILKINEVFGHKVFSNKMGMILRKHNFEKVRKRDGGSRIYGYYVHEFPRNPYTTPTQF
ncbi:virulence-associated protein E /helicase/ primase [Cellulophaga phage phi46:1]|uniref:DNA primase n=1 Tax=Cellulophaga phage phi46:1 TaxID=1327974 RepID=UPI0003515FA3|nr:DNA primase [Cellulophaga phage phi46:1]AGO47843.1 virulence-associated protein E /helicase/ primase [Cellulophaga phage phi46:1]